MNTYQVGDLVHYVLPDGQYPGEHRPALIVKIWPGSSGFVQLQVFTDDNAQGTGNDKLACPSWRTSVKQDEDDAKPGTWHTLGKLDE